MMKILIACETSATVRDAFRKLGHDAWSCDILPCDIGPEYHIQGDAIEAAYGHEWDMMIAHPPCTYLSSSGLHWNRKRPERAALTEQAASFALKLANAPIRRKAIENPIGRLSTAWRKPNQIIQPHQFGHDASKATCLWLENLEPLVPTKHVEPRMVSGKPRWANQTDSGQNRLAPSPDRWKERSKTYQGIADAMANQWGNNG
jgi:hypothetical protein